MWCGSISGIRMFSCWDTKHGLILTCASQQTLSSWSKQTEHSLPPTCCLPLKCLVLHRNSCPRKMEVFLRKFSQFQLPSSRIMTEQISWPCFLTGCEALEYLKESPLGANVHMLNLLSTLLKQDEGGKKICDLLTLWSSEVFVNHNFPDMKDLLRRAEK